MKRLSSWALPIILGVAGVALIIAGSLDLDTEAAPSLPPIAQPTPVETEAPTDPPSTPEATPTATDVPTPDPTPSPTRTPLPDNVTALQLEVPSVGVNVAVRPSTSDEIDRFPPTDAAYILGSSAQPGRNGNSYIFAHALNSLFKPLWNVQLGAQVLVRMSDGSILEYVVTEVRPNVACPDPNAPPHENPPLALQLETSCDAGFFWTRQTDHERLTLQTSQGYNRNWGELILVAEPS